MHLPLITVAEIAKHIRRQAYIHSSGNTYYPFVYWKSIAKFVCYRNTCGFSVRGMAACPFCSDVCSPGNVNPTYEVFCGFVCTLSSDKSLEHSEFQY